MTLEMFQALFDISRQSTWSLGARLNKSVEELGELATSVLIISGDITHKTLDEPVEGEVADVTICIVDVLCRTYPNAECLPLYRIYIDSIKRKTLKWKALVERLKTGDPL